MIEFKNVSKVYNNGTEALRNLSLSIAKGEFVFIVDVYKRQILPRRASL